MQGLLQFCLPVVSYLFKENINDVSEYPLSIFYAGEKDCDVQRAMYLPFSETSDYIFIRTVERIQRTIRSHWW
jgi:hypothetical protein